MQFLANFIRTDNLSESLSVLIMGMLAIFAVIGLIILVTIVLNYFGNKIGDKKEDDK